MKKTIFNSIHVNYAEYSYFKQLPKADQIQFLFELYDAATIKERGTLDLSEFFVSVQEYIHNSETEESEPTYENIEGVEQVAIMIDDKNIMIESNSLRATRHIIYKFFESGYILRRDKDMEKMFRKDKVTKYLRIFNIVDQITTLCTN